MFLIHIPNITAHYNIDYTLVIGFPILDVTSIQLSQAGYWY